MKLNGQYKLTYTLDRVPTEMTVKVQLKENEGLHKPGQNLWYGVATVDDKPYEDEDLAYCVNAEYMAETIGIKLRNKRKSEAKIENKSFRIKKEEIK